MNVRPHLHFTRFPSQSEGSSVKNPHPHTTLIDMATRFAVCS
jgi:hypothetical protein